MVGVGVGEGFGLGLGDGDGDGDGAGAGAVKVIDVPGSLVMMFVLELALTTAEPPVKLNVAVPLLAIALNETLATSWLPVTGVYAARAMATEPLPPVLCAATGKAAALLMLTNCNRLAE